MLKPGPGALTPTDVAQSEASASFWAPAAWRARTVSKTTQLPFGVIPHPTPHLPSPGGVRTLGKGRCWGQGTEMGQESRAAWSSPFSPTPPMPSGSG